MQESSKHHSHWSSHQKVQPSPCAAVITTPCVAVITTSCEAVITTPSVAVITSPCEQCSVCCLGFPQPDTRDQRNQSDSA